jgi:hypothetical protein
MKKLMFIAFVSVVLVCNRQQLFARTCGTLQLDSRVAAFLKMIGNEDLTIEQPRGMPMEQIKNAGPPVIPNPKEDVTRIRTADSIAVVVFNPSPSQHLPIIRQTKAACYFAIESYGPGQYNNYEVSPGLTEHLKGLPPAVIINSEFDPLRDDGILYAAKLKRLGVKVGDKCFAGQIHLLVGWPPGAEELKEYQTMVKTAIKESFHQ